VRSRLDKEGNLINEAEPDFNDANAAVEKLREAVMNGE
jgi:hypothetical protein